MRKILICRLVSFSPTISDAATYTKRELLLLISKVTMAANTIMKGRFVKDFVIKLHSIHANCIFKMRNRLDNEDSWGIW